MNKSATFHSSSAFESLTEMSYRPMDLPALRGNEISHTTWGDERQAVHGVSCTVLRITGATVATMSVAVIAVAVALDVAVVVATR